MKCPNCGCNVGRFELNQNCKNCGVNLFYSQQEELLSSDAKRCELEYASLRIFASKLKSAFIGGPIQIVRLVFTLLCVGALFVPFATMKTELPLFSHTISFGGYGIYQSISDGSLFALLDFAKIGVVSGVTRGALITFVSLAFLVIVSLAIVLSEILSFTNIRRSAKCICVLSAIGVAASLAFAVILRYFVGTASALQSISVSSGFGCYISAAMFAAVFVLNLLVIIKKIKPVYSEVDLKRVALNKRVKKGEVLLKDLPLPVFESDEEREKRLKEEAEEKKLEEAVTVDGR